MKFRFFHNLDTTVARIIIDRGQGQALIDKLTVKSDLVTADLVFHPGSVKAIANANSAIGSTHVFVESLTAEGYTVEAGACILIATAKGLVGCCVSAVDVGLKRITISEALEKAVAIGDAVYVAQKNDICRITVGSTSTSLDGLFVGNEGYPCALTLEGTASARIYGKVSFEK
jgi:hypothetical protein